jgi:hypothetical protein
VAHEIPPGPGCNKIREVFVRADRDQVAGSVEADETYLGGSEPGCRGPARHEKKLLISSAVEVRGERGGRSRARLVGDPRG